MTRRSKSRYRVAQTTLFLLFSILIGIYIYYRAWDYFQDRVQQADEITLGLAANALNSMLQRYDPLPTLIAQRPLFRRVLLNPDIDGLLIFANEELKETAKVIGASDVYVMDRTGLALASSNYDLHRTFIGRRFDYRPYFLDAVDGGIGRFHALGTTSGERGFFFAAPVKNGLDVIGVVAVKFTVSQMEEAWNSSDREIFVTDPNNVVFMANRDAWLFRTFGNPDQETIRKIVDTRQYPIERVRAIDFSQNPLSSEMVSLVSSENNIDRNFLSSQAELIRDGWHISVLSPTSLIRNQVLVVLSVYALGVLLIFFLALNLLQRRSRIIERLERHKSEQMRLETMVAERTSKLDEANRELRCEIKERQAKEAELKKTQKELIQTGKLAALGQISAALSHEINQPLAAVKSYAENTIAFLDRERVSDARENVSRISMMADRMATISSHLRNFARRPQDHVGPILISRPIQDAVELLQPKLSASQVQITRKLPDHDIWAVGGQLRLQQVLVNLISNAIDALEKNEEKLISISAESHDEKVHICVEDNGPGLLEEATEQAFEPFFTTKEPGKGLGLGLSISYNIIKDFGGVLHYKNNEDGGAVFTIILRAGEVQDVAAE